MTARVFSVPDFEGREARVVVGPFGPFEMDTLAFQVLGEKRSWIFWTKPAWITLYDCLFSADAAIDKGFTLDQWTHHLADAARRNLLDAKAKREARAEFFGVQD